MLLEHLKNKRIFLILKQVVKIYWPYLTTVLIIVLPWFLKSGYLFFTDFSWGINPKLILINNDLLPALIIKLFLTILPPDLVEKIYISVIILLILLAGKKLVKVVLNTNASLWLIFVLSLFVFFNPFVYDRALYGQFGILAAYGFLLFTIAYLVEIYKTLNFKKIYLATIMSALVLVFSAQFIFFLIPFYVLFLLSLIFKRRLIDWKKLLSTLAFSFLIVIAINFNWLFAVVSGSSPSVFFIKEVVSQQDLVAFSTAGNTPTETFTNILMMSGFWGKDQFRYLDLTDVSGWQRSFILLLPIIFYGVYLSFKNRSRQNKIFSFSLIIIFVLAVILAVGIKAPIARGLTLFFYNHLPFYKGLREPQKWVVVIIPIYLFYLTLGSSYLIKAKMIRNNKILSGIILAVIIVMLAPSLLWGFNRQIKSTQYPSDWYEVNNLLLSKSSEVKNCSDGILFLPWHMYMSFSWVGKIIANPAPKFFSCPVISGTNMEWGGIYDNSKDFNSGAVTDWLSLKGEGGMPILIGDSTRYVVLAKELDFKSYLWLNNLSYLELIKETNTLLVYEVRY